MIATDQPTCFDDKVIVRVSSIQDGTVLDRSLSQIHDPKVVATRHKICQFCTVSYDDVVYQRVVYSDSGSYSLIAEVDERSTSRFTDEVVADALFTRHKGVGMMLPIADCVGTVVYDPVRDFLALAHMGRHSSLTDLLSRLVKHFETNGSSAQDLVVWMSPHASIKSYKLEYFEQMDDEDWRGHVSVREDGIYIDMSGHNRDILIGAGVSGDNIYISPIDTATSPDYYSHLKGDKTGRFAVLAMMKR